MPRDDATRERIKTASLEVFSEKGFQGTTMSDIAHRAGVALGTIYKYFQNKEQLFQSLNRPDLLFPSAAYQERREAILEAALKVFGHRGYHGASLEQIAGEAGISKSTIYLYFASKEQLFAALAHHTRAMELLEQYASGVVIGDVASNLTTFAHSFLSTFENPDRMNLLRLVLGEMPRFSEVGRIFFSEVAEKGINTLSSYFRQLIARGDLRALDTRHAATGFIGMLLFVIIQHYLIQGRFDPLQDKERISANLVDLFLRGALPGRGYPG